jgi:hypothetical protein
MAGCLPLGDRFQQFVGAPQKHAAVIVRFAAWSRSVGCHELSLAVLTDDALAEVLDADLETSSTRWAFLNEVGDPWHIRKLLFAAPLSPTQNIVAGNRSLSTVRHVFLRPRFLQNTILFGGST